MSLPAMSLGDRFCMSGVKGWDIGGGGWVHPKGSNSMPVSERDDGVGRRGEGRGGKKEEGEGG